MTPPDHYFRRCNATEPGAQRVGPDWYIFRDSHCLELWLAEIEERKKHEEKNTQETLTLE